MTQPTNLPRIVSWPTLRRTRRSQECSGTPGTHKHPPEYMIFRTRTCTDQDIYLVWVMKTMNGSCRVSSEQAATSSASENQWATRSPLDEARDFHRMVMCGSCTVESVRDLISVPQNIESALLAYSDLYPTEGVRIQCVLRFRRRVGEEFEKLVRGEISFIASGTP
jgi:hypothetical protein